MAKIETDGHDDFEKFSQFFQVTMANGDLAPI